MHLHLLNFIVGIGSFWNLVAPAIALGIFVVGFVLWGRTNLGTSRIGLVVGAVGVLALLVTGTVDGVRNVHDANELGSAAHQRYGLRLTYGDDVVLFDSSDTSNAAVAGRAVTVYGCTDLVFGGTTAGVELDRFADGSFALAANGRELPRGWKPTTAPTCADLS